MLKMLCAEVGSLTPNFFEGQSCMDHFALNPVSLEMLLTLRMHAPCRGFRVSIRIMLRF